MEIDASAQGAIRDPARRALIRLSYRLTLATEALGGVLLAGIVVMNALQVFFRYAVGAPLGWTEETMRYSVVWMTYIAAGAALFRGEHMVIGILDTVPSAMFRRVAHVAVMLCMAAFCLVLVWQGYPLAVRNGLQVSPTLEISMFWPYLAVAAGGALMLVKIATLILLPPGFTAGHVEPGLPADETPR